MTDPVLSLLLTVAALLLVVLVCAAVDTLTYRGQR